MEKLITRTMIVMMILLGLVTVNALSIDTRGNVEKILGNK